MTTPSSSIDSATESGASGPRVLIVSNRLPITMQRDASGLRVERSAGGLATGLRTPHERSGGYWIGWPGDLSGLDNADMFEARQRLHEMHAVPVTIQREDANAFYEDISNGILWPLFHDRLDRLPLTIERWDAYERVNETFADVVASVWQPGDVIWVHDYQLMRLPRLLRERLPAARIGFFLHIPFPNPEMFLVLPVRKWLVEGLLGADLIGFHTRRYRGHFTGVLRRVMGLEMDAAEQVRHEGRAVRLGIFPMGVDARDINARGSDRAVSNKVLEYRTQPGKLLLGIDRLDYTKGMPRRIAAFERLLHEHPDLVGHVRFLQLAVPSREGVEAYREFRGEFEGQVARINGQFATPSWTPINYMYRSLDDEDLFALYRTADVMVVTPLRDGMNLVAKEFCAARNDEGGVLLLSEFAGAADELVEALIVNPYDISGVANAMYQALTMDSGERRRRMRTLRERVMQNDVHAWAQRFLTALSETGTSAKG